MPTLRWIVRWNMPLKLPLTNWSVTWMLALAVLAAYANALGGVFQFDDYNVIVNHPAVHTWSAWWREMPGIRPLLKASYVANWWVDSGATGFHLVNVTLHFINALLVFGILRRLVPHLGIAQEAAWVAALIFALHPAQTEAVTYISGRSVSLMAIFTLASLLTYLKARDGIRPIAWRTASVVFFIAALATKEIAWVLPLVLLLCEGIRRDFGWRGFFARSAAHCLVPLGLMAAVLLIPAYFKLLAGSLQIRSVSENLLTQIDGVLYLITRPLLTLMLNIDPDLSVHTAVTLELALKASVLIGMVVAAIWQWRKSPHSRWICFGILWFFIWLLPTNSILPRMDVANDRQLYLALIGPALIVGGVLVKIPRPRRVLAVTAVMLLLGVFTLLRNQDYRSEIALWEATVKYSPDKARVWNNLGYARQQVGDIVRAKEAYQRALVLDPASWKAKNNLDLLE